MSVTKENRNTWRRTVTVAHCVPPVSSADWRTKPGIRVDRLAENSLNHTAAFTIAITIITVITTTFVHGVYIYIPETNRVQYGT